MSGEREKEAGGERVKEGERERELERERRDGEREGRRGRDRENVDTEISDLSESEYPAPSNIWGIKFLNMWKDFRVY